ncbi:hypothetical protein ACQJ9E_07615 [Helicobacter pylori]
MCYQSNHLQNRLASVSEHSSGFAPILFALAKSNKIAQTWCQPKEFEKFLRCLGRFVVRAPLV